MSLRLYDAHNHLQDERFGGRQSELLSACAQTGVAAMVVNGSREADWSQVLALAKQFPWRPSPTAAKKRSGGEAQPQQFPFGKALSNEPGYAPDSSRAGVGLSDPAAPRIIASFGYHPWYLHERTADWLKNLSRFLDEVPSAVGEIGLDRWKPDLSYDGQEEGFIAQLRLAAERNLPVSIHCLQAWGRMLELLKAGPRPDCGFLLHSYGGPKEMVLPLADLGAYFSLPGFYAHERKARQRESFQYVPAERLLIETDAPDQMLPEERKADAGGRNRFGAARVYALSDPTTGKALNHPANLAAVYEFAAELHGVTVEALATQVEQNFQSLFGGL